MAEACHGGKPALVREDGDVFTKEVLPREAGDNQMYPLEGRTPPGANMDFEDQKHSRYKKTQIRGRSKG